MARTGMTEKTKDRITYLVCAIALIAGLVFAYREIYLPFHYGLDWLGWYKIIDNFSIANIARAFDYYPFWQKVTYLGIGFATLIIFMQIGIFFMMNAIRIWVKKLVIFNCGDTK